MQKARECLLCGKQTINQKYCSRTCYYESRRVYKDCPRCGKSFFGTDVYCSEKCKKDRARKSKVCKWCQESFVPTSPNGIYCSIACHKMYEDYGDKDLNVLDFPKVHEFIIGDAPAIWIPVTAKEIEVVLYLHEKGLPLKRIMFHVKRWRKRRKEYRIATGDDQTAKYNVVRIAGGQIKELGNGG